MPALSIQVPFPVFNDRDGQPLDNGYVWIGTPNLSPQTNPVNVYFDEALTIIAPQPLRTINGYISRFGSPAQVYVDGVNFSILVQDNKGTMVYNFPEGTGISPNACGVTYSPPFTGAVPYPVCEKLEQTVSVKDFGAVGDGVTDDTDAIQAALNSGAGTVYFPKGNYKISLLLKVLTSNQKLSGYGATITAASKTVSCINIGFNGSGFVKTDGVVVEGLSFVGADDGLGTDVSYAIGVYPSSVVPWVKGSGSSNIKFKDITASGFTIGLTATAADTIQVTGCYFTDMKYKPSLSSGGYGILFQTCFDLNISENNFTGAFGDRHAIYISSEPSRTFDSNNVCKNVTISNNNFDWLNVGLKNGFESVMVIRAAFDCVISGNTILGGQGGIDYDVLNAPCENIVINNNIIRPVIQDATDRAAIAFVRSGGSYTAKNVTIVGNTIVCSGVNCHGIQTAYSDNVTVSGNTVTTNNNLGSFGIYVVQCTKVAIGDNNINADNSNSAIRFALTNDNVLIGVNRISNAGAFKYNFATVPTNLKFGYVRSFAATSNGSGGYSVFNYNGDIVAKSATTDANGISVELESWVNLSLPNLTFVHCNSGLMTAYNRGSSGTSVIVGVVKDTGVPAPAATNAYTIIGTILS